MIDTYTKKGTGFMRKELKTVDELIQHMKQKGICFEIVNEEKAKEFLQNSNYYFKLASYRTNYDKVSAGERQGQYINLEFAYLKELSKVDRYLRYLILKMCLDIEHSLKTILIGDIEKNQEEDGYNIVEIFIKERPQCLHSIKNHSSSEYCKNLIEKYYPNFPVWAFMEVISFGDLVYLCKCYDKKYPKRIKNIDLLYSVRRLRNAVAHNNCLLNKLQKGSSRPPSQISKFVSQIDGIGRDMRKSKLSNTFLSDFTTLLYGYDYFVKSHNTKKERFEELNTFVHGRMIEHKEYFEKNECIKTAYQFVEKVVDYLIKI